MKTDRFTDIIRRKLESIRPEFTENDWTKMQAALQQGAPSSSTVVQHPASRSWFARPWVPLTAAASVAALVAVAAWQRAEITTLRQTVQALSPVKPANTQLSTVRPADSSTTPAIIHQTDTVYITRYIPVPAKPSHSIDQPEGKGQWANSSPSNEANRQDLSVAGADGRIAQRRAPSGSPSSPMSSETRTTEGADGQLMIDRSGQAVNERPTGQSTWSATSGSERVRSDLAQSGTNVTPTEEFGTGTSGKRNQRDRTGTVADRAGRNAGNGSYSESLAGSGNGTAAIPGNAPAEPTESANSGKSTIAANFDQLANQPLQLTDTDWNTLLLRKATRRMRPVRTVTIGGTQAPASQSVASLAPRFRLGVGGDLTTRARSTAITGELILGKHWTLGVGYSQSTCSDGDFLSEKDFNMKNPQPFRKEFNKVVDPKADPAQFIANIRLKREQQQIPLQIGYRVPLSKSFTVLPTVGTNLTLSNEERLSFDRIAKVFGGTDIVRVESSRNRPYDVFNNLTFGAAVEWQKNHWVAQAGPLATTQLVQVSNPNAFNTVNVGGRVRLFYQF
jgi:hypothetical protein